MVGTNVLHGQTVARETPGVRAGGTSDCIGNWDPGCGLLPVMFFLWGFDGAVVDCQAVPGDGCSYKWRQRVPEHAFIPLLKNCCTPSGETKGFSAPSTHVPVKKHMGCVRNAWPHCETVVSTNSPGSHPTPYQRSCFPVPCARLCQPFGLFATCIETFFVCMAIHHPLTSSHRIKSNGDILISLAILLC